MDGRQNWINEKKHRPNPKLERTAGIGEGRLRLLQT